MILIEVDPKNKTVTAQSNPFGDSFVSSTAWMYIDENRFSIDIINLHSNAHESARKTDFCGEHINVIIKNEKTVTKLRFAEYNDKIYAISCSDCGTVVYHAPYEELKDVDVRDFPQQIDVDKHVLKKILYPVGKKKHEVSFVPELRSFRIKSESGDDKGREVLELIVFSEATG